MEDNLEIYFCEICSESVPAQDVDTKAALAIKGKVIGACCLPEVRPAQARAATSPVGLTALGTILLAGIAAATVFVDSRFSSELGAVQGEMTRVNSTVANQGTLWAGFDKRFDETAGKHDEDIKSFRKEVAETQKGLQQLVDQLRGELQGTRSNFVKLETTQGRLVDGQSGIREKVGDVETELLRLAGDLAKFAAAPRRAPAEEDKPAPVAVPADTARPDPGPALPGALAHQVARLEDPDAGNRFEAVDQLIQSKNPAAQKFLLPMLKDADAFVRRLTAEGLASFRDKSTVDALIVSLADPESIVRHTAHGSLKKLTGQSIAFDPDGSASSRSAAQRKWKDWWTKNQDKF